MYFNYTAKVAHAKTMIVTIQCKAYENVCSLVAIMLHSPFL